MAASWASTAVPLIFKKNTTKEDRITFTKYCLKNALKLPDLVTELSEAETNLKGIKEVFDLVLEYVIKEKDELWLRMLAQSPIIHKFKIKSLALYKVTQNDLFLPEKAVDIFLF